MSRSVSSKFRLVGPCPSLHHRNGWGLVCGALRPLCLSDGHGILLETELDRRFGRFLRESRRARLVPFERPWVGVVHCPPRIPRWYPYRYSPTYYFRLRSWQEGLGWCRGMITLSTRMACWLRETVGVPVLAVRHPATNSGIAFNYERFRANPDRRVIHVGWWLRRFSSLFHLPVRRLRKTLLLPFVDREMRARVWPSIDQDIQRGGTPPIARWHGVEFLDYQPADSYDRLLAESLVFLHLHESVANNTVLECIARHTPILVNPLPDVVEYLGEGYPLYFNDLEEAALKADDLELVREAHHYLRDMPKRDLSAESFRDAIAGSALYRAL